MRASARNGGGPALSAAFTWCPLCCRLANSEKQGVRTHAVSVSGKGAGKPPGSVEGGSVRQAAVCRLLTRLFPSSLEKGDVLTAWLQTATSGDGSVWLRDFVDEMHWSDSRFLPRLLQAAFQSRGHAGDPLRDGFYLCSSRYNVSLQCSRV